MKKKKKKKINKKIKKKINEISFKYVYSFDFITYAVFYSKSVDMKKNVFKVFEMIYFFTIFIYKSNNSNVLSKFHFVKHVLNAMSNFLIFKKKAMIC